MNLQDLKKLCVLANINIYVVPIGTKCNINGENLTCKYETLKTFIKTTSNITESEGVQNMKQIAFDSIKDKKESFEKFVIWGGKTTESQNLILKEIELNGLIICTCTNSLILKKFNESQILKQKKTVIGINFNSFTETELKTKPNQYESLFLSVKEFVENYIDISQS